jgi:hypothetical protein
MRWRRGLAAAPQIEIFDAMTDNPVDLEINRSAY